MKTVAQLEDELDEARETIRQLKEAMTPPEGFLAGIRLGPLGRAVLFTLAKSAVPINQPELNRRVDIVLGRTHDRSAVSTVIMRMRRRFAGRIVIESQMHRGYWLDDESKALVLGTERKAA